MIKISRLNKIYKSKKRSLCHALKNINLTLPDAGLVFVLGKSGSGKSTLLNLIGGLDSITSGSIEVDGNNLAEFNERDFCNYRNTHIGFIFQDYHLIDELTVYENIVLSLDLRQMKDEDSVKRALATVDLAGYENRYPSELSGGEQQRVAIARALVKKPRIILADEPTGNLDTKTATAIITLLKELSKECLILIVSHNLNDANNYADRIIELRRGSLINDKSRNPEFLDEVSLSEDGRLIYPDGLALSEKDVDFINENEGKKLVIKKDKFLPSVNFKKEVAKRQIEDKHLTFPKQLRISALFLKNKALAISVSSFMVAVIMVIMALAQTIIAFDGSKIVAQEMLKNDQDSIYFNKILDAETQAQMGGSYQIPLESGDIQAFYDSGYQGTVYQGVNYCLPVSSSSSGLRGRRQSAFQKSLYINHTLATLIVDERFMSSKFGRIKYCARRDDFHPQGVIITDYVADAILSTKSSYLHQDYEHLVQYGYTNKTDVFIINGIIDTDYKETYKALFDRIEKEKKLNVEELYDDPEFQAFFNDIYSRLGYTYTLNPDFLKECSSAQSLVYPSFFKIGLKNGTDFTSYNNYLKTNRSDGSKAVEYDSSWRYTETPPSIPEGAKYIRVSYHPSYIKKMMRELYGLEQEYPILAFDNGEPASEDRLHVIEEAMLSVNGDETKRSTFVISDYIEIPENAKITNFFNAVTKNNVYCAFYDADKNFLASETANAVTDARENTILLTAEMYAQMFPDRVAKAGEDWLDKTVPHKEKISHLAFWDVNNETPLFEKEVYVGVHDGSYVWVAEDLYPLFCRDSYFPCSLYFDGTEGIGGVFETAGALNFEPQSHTVEGVYTMTKAVDVFIPIFELIAIFLCTGVVFILVNFSSKMIHDKMHEIGILKALGTKNNSIATIFGLQVLLIALLTCVMATMGYLLFIDVANDVLIESLAQLAPSHVVLDIDFLTFRPAIALTNCVLISVLALISMIFPMIKIKMIKPVKIIKAKD